VNPKAPSAEASPAAEIRRLGPDRVHITPEGIVIEAARPMDWSVREFCRIPIFYDRRKYYLRQQSDAPPPFMKRYELGSWPSQWREESSCHVVYDDAYVRERDEAFYEARRHDRSHTLLLPFYPLLGWGWADFKNRTLPQRGFDPRSVTDASVRLGFVLLMGEAVFCGWLNGGLLVWIFKSGVWRPADWVLLAVLILDTVLRYGQSLKLDVERHWGFCEWLWPGSGTMV
jgi:hypothetical protein